MRKIKAIGNHVFVRRDEQKSDFNGIDISDGAQIKALEGEVIAVRDGACVKTGDRVLLPHIQVNDMVIDGQEYAIARESDLFAVKSGDAYKPVNRTIKVRKCTEDHIRDESGAIALFMTENFIETTHWVEILDVADDCEWITKDYIGWFCISPENDDRLSRILYSKDYCLGEELVKFITDGE